MQQRGVVCDAAQEEAVQEAGRSFSEGLRGKVVI